MLRRVSFYFGKTQNFSYLIPVGSIFLGIDLKQGCNRSFDIKITTITFHGINRILQFPSSKRHQKRMLFQSFKTSSLLKNLQKKNLKIQLFSNSSKKRISNIYFRIRISHLNILQFNQSFTLR